MRKFILCALAACAAVGAKAQSWELGVGGAAMQFNRLRITDLNVGTEGSRFNLKMRHVVWGGNIYAARTLSRAFAVDFQGVLGSAESKTVAQTGVGLQWRLGSYFKSSSVDPYLRVGGNYMYKGFDIYYAENQGGLEWQMANNLNKEGRDGRHLFTVAVGAGTNMWLNQHAGIGLQGDYLFVPRPSVANSLRGIVRVMWRFGGASQAQSARKRHSELVPTGTSVESASEASHIRDTVFIRDTIYIKVPVPSVAHLAGGIDFNFDSAVLTAQSRDVVAQIAETMHGDDLHYLITGATDARGNEAYNEHLSLARARAVCDLLVELGVPSERLKAVGIGKRTAHAAAAAADQPRRGDRRVTVEPITNMEYWEEI